MKEPDAEQKLEGEAGKTREGLWRRAPAHRGASPAPLRRASDRPGLLSESRLPAWAPRCGPSVRALGRGAGPGRVGAGRPAGRRMPEGPLRCSPASSPGPGNWLGLLGRKRVAWLRNLSEAVCLLRCRLYSAVSPASSLPEFWLFNIVPLAEYFLSFLSLRALVESLA